MPVFPNTAPNYRENAIRDLKLLLDAIEKGKITVASWTRSESSREKFQDTLAAHIRIDMYYEES